MTGSVTRPVIAGFAMLAVLVLGLGGWAAFSSIAGAVVASGRVEVQNQRQILQHLDGGMVEKLFVKEGDVVAAGQPILQIDGTALLSERAMTDAQYFEVLARSGRLEAERDGRQDLEFRPELRDRAAADASVAELMRGQVSLFAARAQTLSGQREQMNERIAQIESQLSGYAAQISSLERQEALIAREVADKRSLLERGLAQASTVMALDREAARLGGDRGALIAQMAEARGRIVETRLEILNLDAKRREDATTELRDLGVQALQLAEKTHGALRADRAAGSACPCWRDTVWSERCRPVCGGAPGRNAGLCRAAGPASGGDGARVPERYRQCAPRAAGQAALHCVFQPDDPGALGCGDDGVCRCL